MDFVKILVDSIKSSKKLNKEITALVKSNFHRDYVTFVKNYFIENISETGVNQEMLVSVYAGIDFGRVIKEADIMKNLKIGDKVKLKYNPDNTLEKERFRSKKTKEFGRNYQSKKILSTKEMYVVYDDGEKHSAWDEKSGANRQVNTLRNNGYKNLSIKIEDLDEFTEDGHYYV
jgi:hypothetical protein